MATETLLEALGGPSQVAAAPSDSAVANVSEGVRRDFSVQALAEKPAKDERVCLSSVIVEERTFTEHEILGTMVDYATLHGLDLSDSVVVRMVRNKDGIVLVLELQIPNKDGSSRALTYTLKGKHDRNQSGTTNIDETFLDKNGDVEGGGIVLEFLEGEWKAQ